MKKEKIKRVFKENMKNFAVFIWFVLVAMCFYHEFSVNTRITIFAITVIYTVAGNAIFNKVGDKRQEEEKQAREKRLLELEKRYKYYIDLVNAQKRETLKKIDKELLNIFDINIRPEYLISFDNYMDWVSKNRISGKPDSFIIASCLMYSLIDHPIITIKKTEVKNKMLENFKFNIILDIAIGCVFQIISEPITYYEDNLTWVEEKHPKVNIVVSSGIMKDSTLYQRIIATIYRDELEKKKTSIMQFSNLLYLIYLNCQ